MDAQPPEDTVRLPASQPLPPTTAPSAPAQQPEPATEILPTAQATPPPEPATEVLSSAQAAPPPAEPTTAPRLPAVKSPTVRKSFTAKQRLLAALGALLVVLVVIVSVGIILSQSGSHAKVATTPGTTSQTPHATATAAPAAPSGVPLGSPLQAFTTLFGQPTAAYPDSATYVATVRQLQTRIFVALTSGNDGASRGQSLHIEPNAGAWNLTTATAIMQQFLPTDAQHQGDVTGPDGVNYHVYHSNTLAQLFPATTFTTLTRQTTTAGDFSWFCANDLSFCYVGPLVPSSGS